MTKDKDILKEIWEGKLPIYFKLAENEWRSSEPEEIYVYFFLLEMLISNFLFYIFN